MTMSSNGTAAATTSLHNGPVCMTCFRPYIGSHSCDPTALQEIADRYQQMARDAQRRVFEGSTMRTYPCKPENGGSGICGCILGGIKVTC